MHGLGQRATQPFLRLDRQEAELFVRSLGDIVAFAGSYPLEFHLFCSPSKFEGAIKIVSEAERTARKQLEEGRTTVAIRGDATLALMDLQECVSGAKNERLENARAAIWTSAGGGLLAALAGFPAIATLSSLLAVSFLVLTPAHTARVKQEDPEFNQNVRDSLEGSGSLRLLERLVLPRAADTYDHHWGRVVQPHRGTEERAFSVKGPAYDIRVEAWRDSVVEPRQPWRLSRGVASDQSTLQLATWTHPKDGGRSASRFAPLPSASSEPSFWVGYSGPLTKGSIRYAGPFG